MGLEGRLWNVGRKLLVGGALAYGVFGGFRGNSLINRACADGPKETLVRNVEEKIGSGGENCGGERDSGIDMVHTEEYCGPDPIHKIYGAEGQLFNGLLRAYFADEPTQPLALNELVIDGCFFEPPADLWGETLYPEWRPVRIELKKDGSDEWKPALGLNIVRGQDPENPDEYCSNGLKFYGNFFRFHAGFKQTIPGDGDADCDIDLADFAIFQKGFTNGGPVTFGNYSILDFEPDGKIDFDDYNALMNSFTGP